MTIEVSMFLSGFMLMLVSCYRVWDVSDNHGVCVSVKLYADVGELLL